METNKKKFNPNPREKASLFSIIFFMFTFNLFKKGYSKDLDVDDLYDPLQNDRSKYLGDKLQRNWNRQLEKAKKNQSNPSLLRAIISTFWVQYFYLGLLNTSHGLQILQPILLGSLLDCFNSKLLNTKNQAYLYAGLTVLVNILIVCFNPQNELEHLHKGMNVRTACSALIYRKSLKLHKNALGDTSPGKIVNLLSNDVRRFDMSSFYVNQIWSSTCFAIIVIGLLYKDAGFAGIIGVVAFYIIIILQVYISTLSAKFRNQAAFKTDARVRLMDEIISGIHVIKMYAWEQPFKKMIMLARKAEIKVITKASYVRGTYMAFVFFTSKLALFFALLTIIMSGGNITTSKVFVFSIYYNLLTSFVGGFFIRSVIELAELSIAIKRIQTFLLSEEYNLANTQVHPKENIKNVKNFKNISIKNLTVKWNCSIGDSTLHNINLNIQEAQLLGVIGPVGSGKSSLLQSIMGELDIIHGEISVFGKISYASQEPWIFSGTIRQNILFGENFNKKRYQEIIEICALETDFKQFACADLTIISDMGCSLSGGQKARINLARAVYRDADTYLLDDPLSAVDVHVAKHLYDKCINGYLRNKIRILVTHQVQFLRDANHIIILNNGCIEDEGTFNVLAIGENIFAKLLIGYSKDQIIQETSQRCRTESVNSNLSENHTDPIIYQNNEYEEENKILPNYFKEKSFKGKVRGILLFKYFLAGSGAFEVVILVIGFIATQIARSSVDFWLGFWSNIEEYKNQMNNTQRSREFNVTYGILNTTTCLYIYGSMTILVLMLALIRSFYFCKLCMRTSKNIYSSVSNSVTSTNMHFFYTNPCGRILNRFSKDMGSIDEMLPSILLETGQLFLIMAGVFFIVVIVNPYFLIMITVLCIILFYARHIYLKSSNDIKRLEGITKSPVLNHLKATIEGLTTVRAFGAQFKLANEFDNHQDKHSSAWYMFLTSSAAFGFYLDAFSCFFIGVLTFTLISFGESFGLGGGEVGLAISQAMGLTNVLQWTIRRSAEIFDNLVSVERVLEYKMLPKETQPRTPINLPQGWPQKGEIIFKNTSLRYSKKGPLVLKNLNFTIKHKEKVGVVGRTGAGKSSLIQALCRLTLVKGIIQIDGIDTENISLESLRIKLSIIPQDPVLFSGTLRYNLDPFEIYSDEELYKAIEDVKLKDSANILNRLENHVMEKGCNYSVGQKQLICLARAILKQNRILILDEATANVDPQTGAQIQEIIRKKFKDCSVITIAHRLNTIIDFDKVMVLDAGELVEFDHPHLLLQNANGFFYKMVNESGTSTSNELKRKAFRSYENTLHPKVTN